MKPSLNRDSRISEPQRVGFFRTFSEMKRDSGVLNLLASLIIALSAIQSAGGLFFHALYRDGAWILTAWRGNDVVTLLVAVPLLTVATLRSGRGSRRVLLLRLSMFFYMFYNYGYYVFGAAINRLFPLYLALLTLSGYALIITFVRHEFGGLESASVRSTTCKWVAGFMILMACIVACVWLVPWIIFLVSGKPPQLAGSEDAFRLVASMALSIQVPALMVAAILLWRQNPWGLPLSVMLMTAGAVYMLVLLAFSPSAARAGIDHPWQQAPLWVFLGAGCAASSLLLFRDVNESD